MNHVYILDCEIKSGFASLLMNDLSNAGMGFSNIRTTHTIDTFGNVAVFIPSHINNDELINGNDYKYLLKLLKFKKIFVLAIDNAIYKDTRKTLEILVGSKPFRYYQSIGFDTLLSRIVTEDCDRVLRRFKSRL